MPLEISVKVPQAFLGGDDVAATVRAEIKSATSDSTMELRNAIVPLIPVGVAGELKAGVQTTLSEDAGGVLGSVFNSVAYAVPVEFGSRPHFPPIAPLALWAQRKFSISPKEAQRAAHAIARKISKRGTPAARMFSRGLDARRAWVIARFEQMNARIAERLAGRG